MARVYCLSLAARLNLQKVSFEDNQELRKDALLQADRNGWPHLGALVCVNWVLPALYKDQLEIAESKLEEAKNRLGHIPQADLDGDPDTFAIRARVKAHEAKLLIRKAIRSASASEDTRDDVNAAYEEISEDVSEHDHLRMNFEVEWADELHGLHRAGVSSLAAAEVALERAGASADSHACDLCRGYYHQVLGNHYALLAEEKCLKSPQEAISLWQRSAREGAKSLGFFQISSHPYMRFAEEIRSRADDEARKLMKPSKIFLSHKGSDKQLVRRFRSALEAAGFRPWLDEDALTAGVPLDRGLLQGMKDSCAAVFFITPDFRDEGYLATEIDYAVSEQRSRPGEFVIITLVFSDTAGQVGLVPPLLRRLAYKQPASELEALVEILRAVPLTILPPRWT